MKFMSKHTSGPWLVGPQQSVTSRGWSISDKNGDRLAFVLGEHSPELQANARLIASAPDLLVALMLAKDMMIANDLSLPNTFEVIDEALAKVRGEMK